MIVHIVENLQYQRLNHKTLRSKEKPREII